MRLQQIVQPLRLRAFLEGHAYGGPIPFTKLMIAFASVGTVACMRIVPLASRTVATLVAWCTSNARY